MPKRTSEELYQALNGPSSDSDESECYDTPPGMMEQILGRPFTEKEKSGGKVMTYKQLCEYMKTVRIRDENNTGELEWLRYENSALKAQCRQYRCKAQKIQRIAYAAVQRDDYINDTANAALENDTKVPTNPSAFESDHEDKKACNKVVYYSARELHSEE